MQFRVEYSEARFGLVIVRQCEAGAFELPEHPHLGGVAIHRRIDQPRALTPEGEPDFTVWGLFPLERTDAARFNAGDVVALTSEP
jgi:hypothetical protein